MSRTGSSSSFVTIAGPELGSGPDDIGLLLGEDCFDGDVQFTVSVNGVQVGGVQTITAIQSQDTRELFTLHGDWAAGSTVSVDFLNDAWDGQTGNGHDRNLYVDGIAYDGATVSDAITPVLWSGPAYFSTRATIRAQDFVSDLGVNAHTLYYSTPYASTALELSELQYLGISLVRDGGANGDPATLDRFMTEAAAGIRFDFSAAPSAGLAVATANMEALLDRYPGSVVSTEGVNEVSATSFTYGGLTGQPAANLYQQQLHDAVRADPALSGVAVVNYTALSVYDADAYTQYGDLSQWADLGNVHMYGFGGMSNFTETLLPRMLEDTPTAPGFVVSELGYDTLSNDDDVSAKYLLDGVLDMVQAGASAVYLYELMDEFADPDMTDTEAHFGLFDMDGRPKEAAVAIHDLTTILADNGADAATFVPGTLAYEVDGLPDSGGALVIGKSDGSFDLAVWAEPQLRADLSSDVELTAPVTPVTVHLGTVAAVAKVFDPLLGTDPIAIYADTDTVVLGITDHPLIIEIDPPAMFPPVSATGANTTLDGGESQQATAPPTPALFDQSYYLAHNPDVAAAGVNAWQHYLAAGWKEGRNPSAAFDTHDYLAAHPDVRASGMDPLLQYLQVGQAEGARAIAVPDIPADPMVDAAYYYAHNPDVLAAGVDAGLHYMVYGGHEGRNPDAWFDSSYYLRQNPDVAASGMNPLQHFEQYGWAEGRAPSLMFDDAKYLAANPDVAAAHMDPLLHYVEFGMGEGRATFLYGGTAPADPLIDTTFYDHQLGATLIPGGRAGAEQAAWSYHTSGWQRGLNPDALFDTSYYLSHNPDVAAAGIDPLQHYETYGWKEGRNPSALFSTNGYLAANSDVKAAGVDPLLEYVQQGQAEGRALVPVSP